VRVRVCVRVRVRVRVRVSVRVCVRVRVRVCTVSEILALAAPFACISTLHVCVCMSVCVCVRTYCNYCNTLPRTAQTHVLCHTHSLYLFLLHTGDLFAHAGENARVATYAELSWQQV